MSEVEGAQTFGVAVTTYDSYMGWYSLPLAEQFADAAGVAGGVTAIDVGCGPGALTGVLVDRLGPAFVYAFDPSPPFCHECAARCCGVVVKQGRIEAIPFETDTVDHAMAQLVLHFVRKPFHSSSNEEHDHQARSHSEPSPAASWVAFRVDRTAPTATFVQVPRATVLHSPSLGPGPRFCAAPSRRFGARSPSPAAHSAPRTHLC